MARQRVVVVPGGIDVARSSGCLRTSRPPPRRSTVRAVSRHKRARLRRARSRSILRDAQRTPDHARDRAQQRRAARHAAGQREAIHGRPSRASICSRLARIAHVTLRRKAARSRRAPAASRTAVEHEAERLVRAGSSASSQICGPATLYIGVGSCAHAAIASSAAAKWRRRRARGCAERPLSSRCRRMPERPAPRHDVPVQSHPASSSKAGRGHDRRGRAEHGSGGLDGAQQRALRRRRPRRPSPRQPELLRRAPDRSDPRRGLDHGGNSDGAISNAAAISVLHWRCLTSRKAALQAFDGSATISPVRRYVSQSLSVRTFAIACASRAGAVRQQARERRR